LNEIFEVAALAKSGRDQIDWENESMAFGFLPLFLQEYGHDLY
jgi:hypothetical protein